MNDVRRRLAAGVAPAEANEFRRQITSLVAEVEQICRRNRTSPDGLPGPSRRAYYFLKTLDLTALPAAAPGLAALKPRFQMRGLGTACKRVHAEVDALARKGNRHPFSADSGQRACLIETIHTQVERVDRKAHQAGASPAALPIRSRRAYQWLGFLSDPANLDAHIAAVAQAQELRQQLFDSRPLWKRRNGQTQIELFHTSYLYRSYPANERRGTRRLAINEGFLGAPDEVIEALMLAGSGLRTGKGLREVRRYAGSDDFAEVVQAIEMTGQEWDWSTQGRQYDLADLFERVNADYFGGQLDHPRLTWNRTLSRRKFGHYQPSSDTVMISITLDDPQVPQQVIEFVMYHELLHKALGVRIVNGRRLAHTREFRELEKKFPHFEDVQKSLRQLAA